MIVVSGASGNLGRRVVQLLIQHIDASRVVALSRTPDQIADLGVETRFADFYDPGSLVRAFDSSERLLITSVGGNDRFPPQERAVDAAVRAGVGHVIFTSFTRAAEPGNPNRHVSDFAATEAILVERGLPFTVLRFNLWPETLSQIGVAPRAVATGVLPSNAGDGRVGHVTRDDSAAVAAAVLADGGYQGQLMEVTGPAAVTDADIATALTEATGRPVRYEPVSDQQIAQALIAQGIPEPFARPWGADGIAKRDGWFDMTTHAVQRLTGRAATSITEFFAVHRTMLLSS